MKEDVVDAWTRRSRLPELMTLELNSQVAGYNTARRRLFEIIDRYGAATVTGVMRKMIDDTSATVGERLRGLPDATWRDERYVAGATQNDRRLYRVCMTFDKKGDRLLVSNEGTDPAVGSFNTAPGVFRAAVLNGLLPTIAYDQYLCAAGVLRQIDFDLTAGAITTASHPSAVSTSMGSLIAINQAHCLGGKMLSGDAELARHAFATTSGHSLSNNSMFGTDQYGNRYADTTLDTLAGGIGAFSHRDGIDFGGRITGVGGKFSDVERFEQVIPFLFVYRRELPYSGGHGRWRGGVTLATAWVGHNTEESFIGSGGLLKSVTTGLGLCGGYPATSGSHWHATDTDIQQWFGDGRVPGDPGELRKMAPHGDLAPPKKYDNRLGIHDVFELVANPGAGWGDPLERDPHLVEDDLREGRVRANEVDEIYGVVAGDPAATAARRAELRAQRLVDSRPPRLPAAGSVPADARGVRVIEGVALTTIDGVQVFACVGCGQVLGAATHTYRLGCRELDLELTDISELFTSSLRETGELLVFRRYLCPGCGRALDGNVCRAGDEPFCDVKV
jgi:N-methylhydantoinase B